MFREGPEGFTGVLSAEKYINITGATRSDATRVLQDLVGKGALSRRGKGRILAIISSWTPSFKFLIYLMNSQSPINLGNH